MSEIIKSKEHVKNSSGTYDTIYKETLAELVKGLDGRSVQEMIDQHERNAANPHGVTAAQVGLGKTLTFTGAASGTYNGMAAQTVDIPAGKRTCRFVVGTSTAGWTAKDCDYLCDGTDDQVEINAAIQALPSTGGEVVILDGTYSIAARIAVDKDNTTLTGNGQATRLQRKWDSTTGEGVIHVTSDNNTIQNLKVDGNKAAHTSINNHGISLVSASYHTTITGNTCHNNGGSGIWLSGTRNTTITGNTCHDNDYGIRVYGSTRNATITGNTCHNNGGSGIRAYRTRNTTITGNTCHNNGGSGIWLLYSSCNTTITGNTCHDNDYGIRVGGEGSTGVVTSNAAITGNICIRGTGLTTDYTSTQYTIRLDGTSNKNNLVAYNNIMGKNYVSDGGTGNTFTGNKYN